jgi:hypothetical protein
VDGSVGVALVIPSGTPIWSIFLRSEQHFDIVYDAKNWFMIGEAFKHHTLVESVQRGLITVYLTTSPEWDGVKWFLLPAVS